MPRTSRQLLAIALTLLVSAPATLAQHRGRDMSARSSARSSVNRNTNVNANRNVNVNQNSNVNVNVNRDVDVDVHGGYYGRGYSGGCCYNPVSTAAAVTAATVVTAAVIGSMVNTLPPSCTVVVVGGITYQQCGSTWYQPQFVGSTANYVVVAAPR